MLGFILAATVVCISMRLTVSPIPESRPNDSELVLVKVRHEGSEERRGELRQGKRTRACRGEESGVTRQEDTRMRESTKERCCGDV